MEPWTVPITIKSINRVQTMKKTLFAFAALLAIAAVACQKETAAPEIGQDETQTGIVPGESHDGKGTVIFTARLEEGPATHSVIGAADGSGNYQPLWTESDGIIVNGVASTNTEILNGGLSARFTVEGVEAPFVALGPVSKSGNLTYDAENKTYKYLVNGAVSPQGYSTNGGNPTYSPNHAVIAAYSTGSTDLAFRHLTSYIKITVNPALSEDHDNIRYVYVRGGDKGKTAGYWTATYTDADNISIAPTLMSSIITLDCGEEGVAQGTPMIVAIPAYNYSDGLIITIKDVNGNFCSYSLKASAAQFADNAGAIVDFEPVFSPASGTINSAEDWEEFAAEMNSSNDFDHYRWVGNGTVKLGDDIDATNLTQIKGRKGIFPYNFDGQGHTITRSTAIGSLFRNVRGTVRNLNLSGSLTTTGTRVAALADTLYNGGSIEYCNNNTSIIANAESYAIIGGIVSIMTGGTISHCNNTAAISVSVDCSTGNQSHLQAAGIVGQVYTGVSKQPCGDVLIEYCNNSGAILGDPICNNSDYGITYASVGGIAAWLRGTAHSYTIDHCENTGSITYSGEHVSVDGMAYNTVFAGGIAGIAADMNTGYLRYNTGLDVTISNCTNTGTVHNCGINVSTGEQNLRHIYTGGIAGSCVGKSSKHASITSCKNKGTLLTYDITGDSSYAYPEYCQVVGGLVGFGGYLDIDDCIVNCTIGNGKRACNSIGGAIGHAIRTFNASNSKIWFTLYFTRISNTNHINSACVAVAPMKYGSTNNTTQILLDGSTVSDIGAKGNGFYYNTTTGSKEDDSLNCTKTFTIGGASTGQLVRGNPTSTNTETAKVTFSGNNVTLTEAPED